MDVCNYSLRFAESCTLTEVTYIGQLAETAEYTDCIFAEVTPEKKMTVLDIKLNNLKARLQ